MAGLNFYKTYCEGQYQICQVWLSGTVVQHFSWFSYPAQYCYHTYTAINDPSEYNPYTFNCLSILFHRCIFVFWNADYKGPLVCECRVAWGRPDALNVAGICTIYCMYMNLWSRDLCCLTVHMAHFLAGLWSRYFWGSVVVCMPALWQCLSISRSTGSVPMCRLSKSVGVVCRQPVIANSPAL